MKNIYTKYKPFKEANMTRLYYKQKDYLNIMNEAIKEIIGESIDIEVRLVEEYKDCLYPIIYVTKDNYKYQIDLLKKLIYDPDEWFVFTEELVKIVFGDSAYPLVTQAFGSYPEYLVVIETYDLIK